MRAWHRCAGQAKKMVWSCTQTAAARPTRARRHGAAAARGDPWPNVPGRSRANRRRIACAWRSARPAKATYNGFGIAFRYCHLCRIVCWLPGAAGIELGHGIERPGGVEWQTPIGRFPSSWSVAYADLVEDCANRGASGCVRKPFGIENLLSEVRDSPMRNVS
jgi:hypothetical protein